MKIPVGIPAVPFYNYPSNAILLSLFPKHEFTRRELCNLARHPMLLALLLSSTSSTRAMLQMTRPPWQPPLYRTSHVINILWNWLREDWMIRDSGDGKWYTVVSFDKNGNYINDVAHIYSLLAPLEGLTLWTFHDATGDEAKETSDTMKSLLQNLRNVIQSDRDPSLQRLVVAAGSRTFAMEASPAEVELDIEFEDEVGQDENFTFEKCPVQPD